MRLAPKILPFTLIAVSLLMTGCANDENANQIPHQTVNHAAETGSNSVVNSKDDASELGKIITLPIMPEEAVWREDSPNKPSNSNNENTGESSDAAAEPGKRKLTAVLFYKPEDTQKLIALIERHKPAEASEIESESWFPAELIAQSQLSGNETVKGNAYAADDFVQPPFSNGRITHISGTDYFILELFTT